MLTAEERAQFTLLAAVGYDALRTSEPGVNQPCWLCMTEEAKERALQLGLAWLNQNLKPIVPFTKEIAEKVLRRDFASILQPKLDLWIRAEDERKTGRENNDPRAFFMVR